MFICAHGDRGRKRVGLVGQGGGVWTSEEKAGKKDFYCCCFQDETSSFYEETDLIIPEINMLVSEV